MYVDGYQLISVSVVHITCCLFAYICFLQTAVYYNSAINWNIQTNVRFYCIRIFSRLLIFKNRIENLFKLFETMVIVENKIILLPGNKNKVILIIKYKYFFLSYVLFTFPFYYYDYRNEKVGKTHTHTHSSRYFWPHSCLFSYICKLFKWKVPKPTPT